MKSNEERIESEDKTRHNAKQNRKIIVTNNKKERKKERKKEKKRKKLNRYPSEYT